MLVGHDLLMGNLQGVMGEQEVRAGEKMKILQGQAGVERHVTQKGECCLLRVQVSFYTRACVKDC